MTDLQGLPIKEVTNDKQQPIINLVDKILSKKKQDPYSDTSALEHEIDQLVYQLYCLSYDEVLIIDPDTPIRREEYERYNISE